MSFKDLTAKAAAVTPPAEPQTLPAKENETKDGDGKATPPEPKAT